MQIIAFGSDHNYDYGLIERRIARLAPFVYEGQVAGASRKTRRNKRKAVRMLMKRFRAFQSHHRDGSICTGRMTYCGDFHSIN